MSQIKFHVLLRQYFVFCYFSFMEKYECFDVLFLFKKLLDEARFSAVLFHHRREVAVT